MQFHSSYKCAETSSCFFSLSLSLQRINTISDCCIVTIAYTGEASSSCFFSLSLFETVYQYYLRLLHCNYRLHWGSFFKLFFLSLSSVYQYYLRLLRCNYCLHWGSFFKLVFLSSVYQYYLRLLRCNYCLPGSWRWRMPRMPRIQQLGSPL